MYIQVCRSLYIHTYIPLNMPITTEQRCEWVLFDKTKSILYRLREIHTGAVHIYADIYIYIHIYIYIQADMYGYIFGKGKGIQRVLLSYQGVILVGCWSLEFRWKKIQGFVCNKEHWLIRTDVLTVEHLLDMNLESMTISMQMDRLKHTIMQSTKMVGEEGGKTKNNTKIAS